MSYPEHLSCRFELAWDGHGKLSHMDVDIVSNADYLDRKQIARMFLTFKKDTTWDEAQQLEAMMNRHLRELCVVHLAGGET